MEDKTNVKCQPKECKCIELDSKCVELESEIEKKKTEYEKLEANYREMETEKNVIEEELMALKREKKENEMSSGGRVTEKVVDLTEEGDGEDNGAVQLMIENKILECEKRRAEIEVEFLKQKLEEFESRVLNEPIVLQTEAGTPCNVTLSKHLNSMEGEKGGVYLECKTGYFRRIRKPLTFEEDRNPSKKMAPSTPSGPRTTSVTAASSGDDNIENVVTPPRRRLVLLRKCSGKSSSSKTHETKCHHGIPRTEDVEDDKSEQAGSESEGESLNGFIVDSSEESDLNDTSSELEDSDENVDFDEILSTLNRSKDQKEWEFEADMLAAFGKDPELCMKAVCALYRQQTSEEKVSRGTLVYNYHGFSKFDARRGTTLAEFLTHGDPQGALKKSFEDLHKYDRKAVEMCRTLATRYSKQLFEIYKN